MTQLPLSLEVDILRQSGVRYRQASLPGAKSGSFAAALQKMPPFVAELLPFTTVSAPIITRIDAALGCETHESKLSQPVDP